MMVRLGRALALAGAVIVLAFYAEVLAHAPVAGQDFRNFYAAATVLQHGGNPYDMRQLLRQEQLLYNPSTPAQRASLSGNPYVQGPPLAIAIMPFLRWPAASLYKLYAIASGAIAALALILLSRLWPARRPRWRAAALLISPVTFLGLLLGQPDALLLLCLVAALWALRRGHGAPAGLVLMLGLVKPQIIAGPIILLALLAHRRGQLIPYLAGALGGALAFVGASLVVAGPTVVGGWVRELAGFGGTTVYTQVDISSLSTLYVGWAPHGVAAGLALLVLAAWATCCALLWRAKSALVTAAPSWDRRHPAGSGLPAGCRRSQAGVQHNPLTIAAGNGSSDDLWPFVVMLTGWLLATPYAHPHDDVLLLPAVWYLLDSAPYRGIARPLAVLLFATWWLLPMTSVLGLRVPLLRGLGLIPIMLLLVLLLMQRRREAHDNARRGLLAHVVATSAAR